jgi:hypothetical protein
VTFGNRDLDVSKGETWCHVEFGHGRSFRRALLRAFSSRRHVMH